MNEFGALECVDAPIADVLVHFHRCQHKILIDVEVNSVTGIEVKIPVNNMTSKLSLSVVEVLVFSYCAIYKTHTEAFCG